MGVRTDAVRDGRTIVRGMERYTLSSSAGPTVFSAGT